MNSSPSNSSFPSQDDPFADLPGMKETSVPGQDLPFADIPFDDNPLANTPSSKANPRWSDYQAQLPAPPSAPKAQRTNRKDAAKVALAKQKLSVENPAISKPIAKQGSAPPTLQEAAPKQVTSSASDSDKRSPGVLHKLLSLFHIRFRSRDSIAFLCSLIAHTLVMLSLMSLVYVAGQGANLTALVIATTGQATEAVDANFEINLNSDADDASPLNNQRQMTSNLSTDEVNVSAPAVQIGVGEIAIDPASVQNIGSGSALENLNSSESTPFFVPAGDVFGGYSIDGRATGKRRDLAMANGGNAATEAAVEAAIVWLVKHQFRDGSWSTIQDHPDCMFQCRNSTREDGINGVRNPKSVAATGLALLTMLGAGYTHREGPYRDEVYRALQFLLNAIQNGEPTTDDPRMPGQFVTSLSNHMMYEQGIASFALCEAYQMTKDPWLEPTCQKAVNFIRSAQAYDGSWGYYPSQPGDLSIVGWQMMALRSASAAGLVVPTTNVRRVDQFLNSKALDNGTTYFYRRVRSPAPELTAIGALMRLMRGWSPTDPKIQKSIEYVVYRELNDPADDGPESTDVYFNYYATNLLFYAQSGLWPAWNERMKQIYLSTQAKEGHEAGSWFAHVPDIEGNGFTSKESDHNLNTVGGRLYTTTMAALTLEVYYRILPIQKDVSNINFEL